VRFENQAQFHPRDYLAGLAARVAGDGSFIFDETHVAAIREGEPCVVECDSGSLTAGAVFMATNVPIAGFQSLLIRRRKEAPSSAISTASCTRSCRSART
jgi:glycine/D-amino acid oxidase-like deaminating enzyme